MQIQVTELCEHLSPNPNQNQNLIRITIDITFRRIVVWIWCIIDDSNNIPPTVTSRLVRKSMKPKPPITTERFKKQQQKWILTISDRLKMINKTSHCFIANHNHNYT